MPPTLKRWTDRISVKKESVFMLNPYKNSDFLVTLFSILSVS